MRTETKKPWNWLLFPFSSVKAGDSGLFAASYGYGVYEMDSNANWGKLNEGMPDGTNIYRLQLQHDHLHACSSKGLFQWKDNRWEEAGITLPCHQYRRIGGSSYASTSDGLWMKTGSNWNLLACAGKCIYDFINLPQYVIVAHNTGVSIYDRFMDEWSEFELNRAVTSLTVFRGHLIGASDRGELLVGDKRGKFQRIAYGGMHIFSVVAIDKDIYVCTDRGLYRLAYVVNHLTLLSIKLGFPVTDVDIMDGQLYMATLFQGIQRMELSSL
ncbi:hypothetical protein M6D81_23745 [Paenibacillus sp. J5C_2022]|uniref:hypothetical protein n=1 Tax=Paenibacillus sp. J5C2022 TaxID=2977129 RepID=UPI0021D1D85B|nr:hypothetical protein [Paenibacillus sp. J5C2022]MCU6711716.1 hypothetical protein [Paenibacillus sp. J5C2022]